MRKNSLKIGTLLNNESVCQADDIEPAEALLATGTHEFTLESRNTNSDLCDEEWEVIWTSVFGLKGTWNDHRPALVLLILSTLNLWSALTTEVCLATCTETIQLKSQPYSQLLCLCLHLGSNIHTPGLTDHDHDEMLGNSMNPEIDPTRRPFQARFRPKWSCAKHILVWKCISEGYYRKNHRLCKHLLTL